MLCCLLPCTAQDDKIALQGIVVDEQNTPINDVFISVNWSKNGLLSHEDGSFYITINAQDTLVFKHTSFEPKAIAASHLSAKDTIKVQLTERTLELGEVHVTNLGTWQEFKHKIENMDADSIRQTDEYRLETMFGDKKRHPIKNPYFRGWDNPKFTVVSVLFRGLLAGDLPNMLYSHFSGDQKRRRKMQKELLQDIAVEKNQHRYNEALIGKILNLKGKELHSFKLYCDYAINLNQSDYKLTQQIKLLYKEWIQNGKKLHQGSLPSLDKSVQ